MSVRWINSETHVPDKYYIEAVGLSTDSKPTANIVTGSVFIELNPSTSTVKAYFFDEDSSTWIEAGGAANG